MKKTIITTVIAVCLGLGSIAFAQTPNAIPYQAVARNASGNVIASQNIRMRFTIHDGGATGTAVYQETQSVTTNVLGLFSVNIGQGTAVSGTFAGINWGTGTKFTQVEMDAAGGTTYLDMGTTQMLSVPFALYAAHSNDAGPQGAAGTNGTNGTNGVDGATGPSATFTMAEAGGSSGTYMLKSSANNIYINAGSWISIGANNGSGYYYVSNKLNDSTITIVDTGFPVVWPVNAPVALVGRIGAIGAAGTQGPAGTAGSNATMSMGAIGAATPNGATITAGVLSLAPANATNPGIVIAADQTFAGAKTFISTTSSTSKSTGALVVNGGVGINENLNVGGHATIIGSTTLTDTATAPTVSNASDATTNIATTAFVQSALANVPSVSAATPSALGTVYGYTSNNSGGGTLSLGHDALSLGSGIQYGVAIGNDALKNASGGNFITAIGSQAGYNLVGGSSNLFLGSFAGYSVVNGNNNIIIGEGNSPGSDVSNTINISNGVGSLNFDGTNWQINNGTVTMGGITYPNTDGATGQVLSTNGNGIASWATPSSGPTGATGQAGTNGTNGTNGAVGAAGATGATGSTGVAGAAGATGLQGIQGIQGVQGATGTAGSNATMSMGAIGAATANGATITSGVLSLAPADATNGGIVTTTAQTIAGAKTFSTDIIANGVTIGTGAGSIANNTAIGNASLAANTTGFGNTANGYQALKANTTGYGNTANGYQALKANIGGATNTANGFLALQSNITGSNNTAIGYNSDVATGTLTNATAIGNGAIVGASNTMQLGNTAVTDIKTSGKYTGSGFATPTGTNAQYLMADGSTSAGQTATISAMQAQIAAMQAQIAMFQSPINTVTIGAQVWTTQNLNVSTYRNGNAIPQITNATDWANATQGAWCYYNNDPANGSIYGKLYNWYAVNDPRGLAPAGYHIPTDAEWTTLQNTLGTDAGIQMKSTSGWDSIGNGTNSTGFEGLPGGGRNFDGTFNGIGIGGYWWSSTENSTTFAWLRMLYFNVSSVNGGYWGKEAGFSVRCIKD